MLGLPFLFGVNVQSKPYILVTEFYGIGGQCVTIGHAAKKLSLEAKEWAFILEKCERFNSRCDIKHNNIILKNSADVREPVIIDFGKMKKAESAKICKLNSKEQDRYLKYYKHIAPEIIWGRGAPSTASDIYSFGQIISLIVYYTKSTDLQKIAKKCIHGTPEKRPKAFNVALEFKEVSNN
ncbi:serine threonine- kinase [Paramuricea clavata]|uniref:Serine threonine- kinase n=1 Tax=Paramuricea clavata TaxID=317549 RepID=A0A7D9H9G0_PARCT|nr:serine threonine- kinase [Paramuricea clavata]